jgi:predicted ferric reductase
VASAESTRTPYLGRQLLWVALYIVLAAAPMLLLLIGPEPPGAGWWWDVSMGLGFAGLAIMGLQFVLTARFRNAEAPFGIDIIYYFHRIIAIVGMVFVLAHFGILRVAYPAALGALNPLEAPFYMTAGRLSLLCFLVIMVTSLWRKPLRIDYDYWRIAHTVLAVAGVIFAIVHIDGVGYYSEGALKRPLWIGYSAFWVLLVVHVRLIKPVQMLRRPYRVAANAPEHGDTRTLVLEPVGHDGFRFQSGQFAWLTIGQRPFRFHEHPFSISSSAERAGTLSFSIKALGDFTSTIPEIETGEVAYVDGPYGVFTIDRYPDAPGAFFVAAGVGIAPIMSMLRTLAERGDSRPFTLVYANRTWDDVIFREELEALKQSLELTILHVLEKPPENWAGPQGFITKEMLNDLLREHPEREQYFLCGPKPVCDSAQRWLKEAGVPLAHIHFELFDMV